jgi:ubiquinone biosynthesis protein
MGFLEWLAQALWLLVFAVIITVPVRRVLGGQVGLPRTFLLSLVALSVGSPLLIAMGEAGGFVTPDGQIVAPLPAVFAMVILTFLWTVALEILALVVLEVIVPTGSVPTPVAAVRGLRGWWRRTRRYLRLSWIASTSGLARELRRGPGGPGFGAALTRALNRSGVTFVKLGQMLSTRPDLLPDSTTAALARLQTTAAPLTAEQVRRVLVTQWGSGPETILASFDDIPLAAASVAQVHRGMTRDGRDVVVKVQRPRARAEVSADSDIMLRLGRTAEQRFEWARAMSVAALARGLADNLAEELDYRVEAANTRAVARALADSPSLVTPEVVTPLSTDRVLVLSWLPGRPVAQAVDRLDESTRTRIADELLAATLECIFVHGVFHADLHPGNIVLLDDDRIGLLDFGSVGVLGAEMRQLLAALVLAVVNDSNVAATTVLAMLFELPPDTDLRALRNDLGRTCTLLANGPPGDASLFLRLLTLMGSYRVAVPGDIAGALRTLSSLEHTLLTLDPSRDLVSAARLAMPGVLRRLAAPERLAGQAAPDAAAAAAVARRLPGRLEQLTDQLVRGEFVLRTRAVADRGDRAWLRSVVDDAVSALLAVAAVVMAVVLFVAPGGPMVTSTVSLYDLIGAGLGFAGMCLVLRLVLRLFRHRPADAEP